jgi:hypothetical protein
MGREMILWSTEDKTYVTAEDASMNRSMMAA